MKNKQLYLLSLISTGLFMQTGANAAPLVSIGDNTDIYFNGSSSLRWSSNIFRNENKEVDDLVWTLSPGFEVNIGRGASNADLSIITRYDVIRYEDNDQLDVETFHIKAVGSYRTSRLDLSGSVSFDEAKSNSGDSNLTQDLIETNNYAAALNGEYRFSPKFSFGAGVRYTETEYQSPFDDQFADRETISVPLDLFYELTPKVDLSVGYTYTTTDIESTNQSVATGVPGLGISNRNVSGYETESHFLNVGARGNLLPKLSGFFKVGYRVRDTNDSTVSLTPLNIFAAPASTSQTNREGNGMLGLDADFTWSATPKLTVNLGLSRDFGVGGEGQSTENSSVDLSGSYSISPRFAASANLGYTLRDYVDTGREDDQYEAGMRFSYSLNQHWRFSTGYTYSENNSSDANRSYESHTLDLTATLRY